MVILEHRTFLLALLADSGAELADVHRMLGIHSHERAGRLANFGALDQHLDAPFPSLDVWLVQAHRKALVARLFAPLACINTLLILIGRHRNHTHKIPSFHEHFFHSC